jgi:hypothetical protein
MKANGYFRLQQPNDFMLLIPAAWKTNWTFSLLRQIFGESAKLDYICKSQDVTVRNSVVLLPWAGL